jgi:hypothetical protein
MSHPEPSEHEIDSLVRAHLLRQSESVDAAALVQRIRQKVGQGKSRLRKHAWRSVLRSPRTALVGLAAAAVVLVVFFGGLHVNPARASAETLVREAREAHALPVDRCYLVQIVPDPKGVLARFPILAQPRQTRLWTRGDRFFMESTGPSRPGLWGRPARSWAWGRDEEGCVWLALNGDEGLRYDPAEVDADELPRAVSLACDVCSMQVETLLNEVLAKFTLTKEMTEGNGPAATHCIRAEHRIGAAPCSWLRSAVLEIDAETRVLRRLVLHRTRNGEPLATCTFTLIDSRPQDDSRYRLEGHLKPGVKPYSAVFNPLQRTRLLVRAFGLPVLTHRER